MPDVNSMVDRWFGILGYDEDERRIALYFDSYRNNASEANRLLSRMRKEYHSDMLTFCVLRHAVEAHKDVKLTVREAMTPQFSEMVSFFREVEESPLNANVSAFRKALERFAARGNLLGEISDADICERISEVGPLRNLGTECLRSSGRPMDAVTRISKDVVLAGSLGELLLKTAGMPDGMVLGYVSREKANEGFFSLMVKSNGNIVSVNDRPVEKYFGQFEVLSRRNDRYTENKSFSVFPYDSVLEMTFKESGVHDLVDKAEVRKENISFDDFSLDEAIRFFIGCMLVSARLSGTVYPAESVEYTTALTRDNLPLLESKALINADNRSVAEAYNNFRIEIPEDSVVAPPCTVKEGFYACGSRNTSVDLFAEWFTPDMADIHEDYTDLLPAIREKYPNEVADTKEHLQHIMLHHLRRDLRDRIQNRIDTYFREHNDGQGGIDAYRRLVLERKDVVFRNLTARYHLDDPEKWEKKTYIVYSYQTWKEKQKYPYERDFLPFNDISNVTEKDSRSSTRNYRSGVAYLRDEDGMCNMRIEWAPRHVDEICRILEVTEAELPKELRGWNKDHNYCAGNSLLSITDPLQTLQNGYVTSENISGRYWAFNVTIAMSKKHWNKVFGKGRKDADD